MDASSSSAAAAAAASSSNDEGTPSSNKKNVTSDPLETAKWTQYLPQAFGIREAVRQSSYRWCVREGYVVKTNVGRCSRRRRRRHNDHQ